MQRTFLALATALALSSCGGGGAPALPSAPGGKTPAVVSFVLKVPVKSRQVRGYLRRSDGSLYVSPATRGVGINFASGTGVTFSSAQLEAPEVAFDLSTCGSNCTANSDGSQTYTVTAPVSPGTYSFEVTTWDAPPAGGSFGGAMLSQAYVADQSVASGSNGTTVPLSLNGIPASVTFVPLPSQSHVEQIAGGYSVIGSAPVQFVANALDADGYVIAGSGAPAFTASDSTGSFTFTEVGTTNVYDVRAVQSTVTNATVSVDLAATPPNGSGLTAVAGKINLSPTPELWVSQSGGSSNDIAGSALNGTGYTSGSPLDFVSTTIPNSAISADADGNLWVVNGSQLQAFNAPYAATPPTTNSNFIQLAGPTDVETGANGLLWIADTNKSAGYNDVAAYNPSNLGSPVYFLSTQTAVTLARGRRPFAGAPAIINSIAVAPTTASIPAPLVGSIWAATQNGIDVLTLSGGSLQDTYPLVTTSGTSAIAIGPDGTVWTFDGTNLNAYALTFTTAPVLTLEASIADAGALNQMAVDPGGDLWIPNGTNSDIEQYTLSGCPASCTVSFKSNVYTGSFSTAGVYITP